jgi:four helix bundle protein
LKIWQDAIVLSDDLFDIADKAENKMLFRFAEQPGGAALSISNNIAEGSGSFSDKEFAYFLNITRKSLKI